MENYLGVTKKEGITDDEIGAIVSIAMAVSGGRALMQFNEVKARSKESLQTL